MNVYLRLLPTLLATVVAGCASGSPPELTPASTTRGTTVVRIGTVTAMSADRVTVEFDDGERASHALEPGETFREGERVRVISSEGRVRVAR
jgi:outer membrane lipoprotein SlyB